MDEEGFQVFVEVISTKSWSRILKIVDAIDAIDERETPQEDKWKKIIKLLHSKGLGVVGESFAEHITDATTFEGAKTTFLPRVSDKQWKRIPKPKDYELDGSASYYVSILRK